ncbi:integrase [Chitinophaga barathri]|uniref:integrase n=1 Tax=Chitinophaga barathri TaxID=1647451 RepID=UPI001F4D4883|nr:integrase [Chitinophaga barathri]
MGKKLSDAHKVWATRLELFENVKTISDLLDRYGLEVVPTKAVSTQRENVHYIKKLRHIFGKMRITEPRPKDVYEYIDRSTAKILARREIALLSHAYTKAIEWGYIDRHPLKGQVRLPTSKPRQRYIEDWEIDECLSLNSKYKKGSVKVIQAYIQIKQLTGMSQGDMLRLQPSKHFLDEGISIKRHKVANTTGKQTIYLWTPELRNAVRAALDARPVHISPWLFCTKRGHSYMCEETGKASGWASMWQRFMERVLAETKVIERFTEHDLRAKAASDASTLEQARALLSHSDSRITGRVYRRKPERVTPIR